MDWFSNNTSLISSKEFPYDYFKQFETLDGINCIRVYHLPGSMRYSTYTEVRTDLVRGMKMGFYLKGFDYGLVVGERVLCLERAYGDKNGREFGFFSEGYKSKDLAEIEKKDSIWVL